MLTRGDFCFQDNVTAFQQVANVLQATIEGLTTSHERQINALQQRLKRANDELRKAEIALNQNVTTNIHINEGLRTKLEMGRNNLHIRSTIEIITASLTERPKSLNRPNPAQGAGVQPVINAVAAGGFNDPNVTFQDAQKAVVGALTAKGGIKPNDISCALASLYCELSKRHHTGFSEALTLREGEQTLSEAIGTMSVILFARRLYASEFDAVYCDSESNTQANLSKL
ncbi:hypothetical protein B0H17DRAFT_1333307 [Mycena rosella]|uniref:Uncharacterized protein n=1 Tax=Mycena rosella TaxID=1033263 RepID=A0AAD7GCZ0_MYCRO|nr:hypothetical protein B0H17DRAFT_1333307 [Mycena rosella]